MSERAAAVRAMLEARSVAVVGASPRPGSFGDRLITELERSPSRPDIHLVNPRYDKIGQRVCHGALGEMPDPVDLVALAVGDHALERQLGEAARHAAAAAVVFGSAFRPAELRSRLASIAAGAGMALCGAGCMGFVNVAKGLRAIGYLEPFPLPAGPVALVTHSGSAFSALLRADRRIGWTLAVSSGQELVTTTADYVDYALTLPATRVIALLIETLRRPDELLAALRRAADADVVTVALTVGGSPGGRAMVEAHSGALAGEDATWEALCDAAGAVRVADLAELVDTLELLAAGRRPRPAPRPILGGGVATVHDSGAERALRRGVATVHDSGAERAPRRGVATVHDSGAERALAVDVAHRLGVAFAEIAPATRERLGGLLDQGLEPGNPLDVWGTGARAREVLRSSLLALAEDPAVDAVALCVDLVHELDGDTAYQDALRDAWAATDVPLCALSNLPSALDRAVARELRAAGIPVLEGTASGLAALGHLVALGRRRPASTSAPPEEQWPASMSAPPGERRRALKYEHLWAPPDERRRDLWAARLADGPLDGVHSLGLLADYGIPTALAVGVGDRHSALAAADAIGYPVVLKTDRRDIAHKTDVGGVVLGLDGPDALLAAYEDLAARLGPEALVMETVPAGVELALGLVRDPLVGPVVVVGAGGVLVEVLADRSVGLPPLDQDRAMRMLERLRIWPLLDGARGAPPADVGAVALAVVGLSTLAVELGDVLDAVDVNPLIAGSAGVIAADALVLSRSRRAG